jgi:glycosyltransferase involved in cell wall biosynthesis
LHNSMETPLVSIITPTFNQEAYLGECIRSALAQSYPNWEQIIVDDGSTDRTPQVAEEFSDPRIRYIRLPHRGLGALAESYNTALAAARGELVGILEGDDLWPADKLALQVPLFGGGDVAITWGRGALIDGQGRRMGERASIRVRHRQESFDTATAFHRLTRLNFLIPSVSVMVRRDVLDRAGGFRQTGSKLIVDLPTWLWITARESGRVCYLNEVLGIYRVYGGQTSQLHRARMAAEHLQIVLELERELGEEALRRVGWHGAARSRALVSGMIVGGEVALAEKRYGAAAREFTRALLQARRPGEIGKAAIGVASSVVRKDLLSRAYSVAEWWKSR